MLNSNTGFILLLLISYICIASIILKNYNPVSYKNSITSEIKIYIFFTGIIICFIAVLYLFTDSLIKTYSTKSWHETPCIIKSIDFISEPIVGKGESVIAIIKIPEIIYTYKINDVEFTSNYYSATFPPGVDYIIQYILTKDVLANYSTGQKTSCYVNPDNYDEAVLHPGFKVLRTGVVGIFLLIIDIIILIASFLLFYNALPNIIQGIKNKQKNIKSDIRDNNIIIQNKRDYMKAKKRVIICSFISMLCIVYITLTVIMFQKEASIAGCMAFIGIFVAFLFIVTVIAGLINFITLLMLK